MFIIPHNIPGGGYTHGANPVAVPVKENIYRIYYNIRDKQNRAFITFLEYDIESRKIIYISPAPVIAPGEPGMFDDCGCSIGCIVDMPDHKKYIYYLGWHLSVSVPWTNYIGLAVYDELDGTCKKYSPAPVLERNPVDYLSVSYPYVLEDHGIYHMWYGSTLKWGKRKEDMKFVIKYAKSDDGIIWERGNHICIEGKDESENAISRPCVIKDDSLYKMWYSYSSQGGERYRIGYAESDDGLFWERKDEQAGIAVSETGFDSQMICYPNVFEYNKKRYMLYNGNGYGKSGFGLAVYEG